MKTRHWRTKPCPLLTSQVPVMSRDRTCVIEPHGDALPDDIDSFSRIKSECLKELDFTLAPQVLSMTQLTDLSDETWKTQSTANGPVYLLLF